MKAEITIDKEDVRDALIRIAREMIGPRGDDMDFSIQQDWRLNSITVIVKDKGQLIREERARLAMEERAAARERAAIPEPVSVADETELVAAVADSNPF